MKRRGMVQVTVLAVIAVAVTVRGETSLLGVDPETLIEPDTLCKSYRESFPCDVSTPSDCTAGETFVPTDNLFGCCPACVTKVGPGASCKPQSYSGHYATCAMGPCFETGICLL